jgi:hypothetical protein
MNSATDKGIAPWTDLEGFSTRNFRYSGHHLTALFSAVANRQIRLANATSNGASARKRSKRSRNLRGEMLSQESANESRSQGGDGWDSNTVWPFGGALGETYLRGDRRFQHRHRIAGACCDNISPNRRTYDFAVHRKYGFEVRLNHPNIRDQIDDVFSSPHIVRGGIHRITTVSEAAMADFATL